MGVVFHKARFVSIQNKILTSFYLCFQEEFKDTKEVIRVRISENSIQHNGQEKKYKRTNNDLQNIHIKIKIE